MIATDERSELAGAVAVVTGGTGGIGSAICERLASAGCRVVIVFRSNPIVAEALLEKLSGTGHCMVQADVTDTASLNRLAGEVRERCGRVQILVNCAGTTRFVPHADLDGLDDTTIDQIFQTNWRGPFATIRALKSLLLESPSPVLINISSIAAVSGLGSNVAYCASKAALNAMTVSLGRALAPQIRVVSVSPGLVDTEFIKGLSEQWRNEQVARTALGRLPTPEDVSRAVLAAATLECSTGCVISVDGGRLLS